MVVIEKGFQAMKFVRLARGGNWVVLSLLVIGPFLISSVASLAPSVEVAKLEDGFISIFDGKTFEGWEGDLDWFRIEDGAIVAGSLERKIPKNVFLCTEEEYGNFELRLRVRLLGDPDHANAGIQIRSRRIPNDAEMIGYQADMGQHYWGCLYDESRRRKVLAGPPDREQFDRVLRPGDWNDYVIRCQGNHIKLWINGFQTVDYVEADSDIEQSGLIGLQIHSGLPSEAWYRDLRIKQLGTGNLGTDISRP